MLSLQSVTTFASLIRSGSRIESAIRSGRYPTISALAGQDIVPNRNNNNNNYNGNNSGNNNSGNNHARRRDQPKPAVAYVDSPMAQFNLVGHPTLNQIVYALAPSHTP